MAQLNDKVLINKEEVQMNCAVYLQGCLSNEEYEQLKEDWNKIGGRKTMALWKYAFENIEVKLKK